MSVVAVLGGSGRLGRYAVRKLLEDGHTVKALVHRQALDGSHPNLATMVGDVHDADAVAALVEGASAIISLVGNAQSAVPDVCSAAMKNLVPAMRASNVRRIVATTGSAAREDREIGNEHPFLLTRRSALMAHMADLVLDGEALLRLLAGSGLAWTGVRLPRLSPDAREVVLLSSEPPSPNATAGFEPAAVAIVAEMREQRWLEQSPFARST